MTNKELITKLSKPYNIISYDKDNIDGVGIIELTLRYKDGSIYQVICSNEDIHGKIIEWYIYDDMKDYYSPYYPELEDYDPQNYIDYFRQYEDIDAYLDSIAK